MGRISFIRFVAIVFQTPLFSSAPELRPPPLLLGGRRDVRSSNP